MSKITQDTGMIPVKRALLHNEFPLPSGGDVTKSFYSTQGDGIGINQGGRIVSMLWDGKVLYCTYKGLQFQIPAANVQGVFV